MTILRLICTRLKYRGLKMVKSKTEVKIRSAWCGDGFGQRFYFYIIYKNVKGETIPQRPLSAFSLVEQK